MGNKNVSLFLIFIFGFLIMPDMALASGGIGEFSGPLEKVVGTITGPAGRLIAIVAMGICGLVYIFNKDDLSGGFKLLLGVVFGISFIAFAGSIVDAVFSFSGATVTDVAGTALSDNNSNLGGVFSAEPMSYWSCQP